MDLGWTFKILTNWKQSDTTRYANDLQANLFYTRQVCLKFALSVMRQKNKGQKGGNID